MEHGPEKLLGIVEKNRVTDMRVSLVKLRGGTFVDLRVFAAAGADERRPTKMGMTFKPELVPELIEVLAKAAAEAPMALWQGADPEKARVVAQRHLETGSGEGPPSNGKGVDEEAAAIFADIREALGIQLAAAVDYSIVSQWIVNGASPTIIVATCRAVAASAGDETIHSLDFFNDAIANAVKARNGAANVGVRATSASASTA